MVLTLSRWENFVILIGVSILQMKIEQRIYKTPKMRIMKLISLKNKMHFYNTIFAGILIAVVVLISCQKGIKLSNEELNEAAPITLDLSDNKQQSDFQNFLKKTVDFLNDRSFSYLFRGYNLSNLSNSDKELIAENMMKDKTFMNKLTAYQEEFKTIEKKYRISAFSKEQRSEVIKFGMDRRIYFLPGLKEKVRNMEIKSFPLIQSNNSIKTENYGGTICSSLVDDANEQLGNEVLIIGSICSGLYANPVAALICWAGLGAWYLYEDNRINSTEYWCNCMIANYGACVY